MLVFGFELESGQMKGMGLESEDGSPSNSIPVIFAFWV